MLKNKIKLSILGKDVNYLPELNFYKQILGEFKFNFIKNFENRKTFRIIDNCELVTGMDSTLIYEAFSRGVKCYFGSFRYDKNSFVKSGNFGWYKNCLTKENFGLTILMRKNFIWFERNLSMQKISMEENFKKYIKDNMIYDFNNTILKKYTKKFYDN